jgi:integrase
VKKQLKTQTNLVRRKPSGMYYFRARVPAQLVPLLGKAVIFDSLKTTNKAEATAAAAKRRYELQQELSRLKSSVPAKLGLQKRLFLGDDEVRAICERYLVHTLARDDNFRFEGMTLPSLDLHGDIYESYANVLLTSVARGDTSVIVEALDGYLRVHVGIELDPSTPSYKKLAYEFLKTEAEGIKAILARQRGENVKTPLLLGGRTSFDSLLEKWAKLRAAKPKTKSSFKATLTELSSVHPGLFVETTSNEHITQWRDALIDGGQAPGTIDKKLSYLRALFSVAVDYKLLIANPCKGVMPPKARSGKSRIPFSIDDLHLLFKSKVYQGFRPVGGGGEASYWLPLIALYTGARLEELAQMRLKDIQQEWRKEWYFEITDLGEGASVKSDSARRRVPVHRELHKFGLMEYIEGLKGNPENYIFPRLKPDVNDFRGGNYSKWFGRYKRKLGIVDKRMVFHSFRHGFLDACRECSIQTEIRDVLVGHANPNVSATYGSATYPIRPLFEAMDLVHYRGLDLTHLYRVTQSSSAPKIGT